MWRRGSIGQLNVLETYPKMVGLGKDSPHFLGTCIMYQSGTKCGVGSHRTWSHFFRLIASILTIFDKKYRILTRRNKRESNLIVLQQC